MNEKVTVALNSIMNLLDKIRRFDELSHHYQELV